MTTEDKRNKTMNQIRDQLTDLECQMAEISKRLTRMARRLQQHAQLVNQLLDEEPRTETLSSPLGPLWDVQVPI